jgi:hypothetical protein
MLSNSSTRTTLCACANAHHASKPRGGGRACRRVYSATASGSVRLWRASVARNAASASAISVAIGCADAALAVLLSGHAGAEAATLARAA